MRKLAVQKPFFLTWLGTYYFIKNSDVCILEDDCYFLKKDVYSLWHKNSFNVDVQERSLTIPIIFGKKDFEKMNEIEIKHEIRFTRNHLNTIKELLSEKQFTKEVFKEVILPVYLQKPKYLIDFNISMIYAVCAYLGIGTDHVKRSSSLDYPFIGQRKKRYEVYLENENCNLMMVDEGMAELLGDNEDVSSLMESDDFFAENHSNDDKLFYVPILKILPTHFNILDILCEYGKETIKFL